MSSATRKANATLDDLARVEGKAELIGGRIVQFMPTGERPNEIAGEIFLSLKMHIRNSGQGKAFTDNMGFAVPELPSGRESFSPDASYYDGPPSANRMDFIFGPPTFAAEVRSKGDYGPAAEAAMAEKRSDYFQAGTRVVWDVDPRAGLIRCYRAEAQDQPTTFAAGDVADAEPAVPRWRVEVDSILT
ncbi:MAG: Uma2 family endonuclease [Isosphaeraceae bacterium]